MIRRLIYLICSVLLLGLVLTSTANASFPGLVAHWRLDEGAGTIVGDASGFGNNGTLTGGQWTTGKLDGAVYLDGVDDYIEVPNVLTEIGTLAFWFKPDWDGADPADYRLFDASLGGIYFFISKGANHADINPEEFGFYLEDATDADYQGIEFDPAGVINADTWHHVAVTWEFGGGPAILYLDGQEVSRANSLGPFPALDPNPRFGLETFTYIPSANGAKAVIDDIMYYDKVLTDAEIQVIMVGLGAFPYAWNPNPKDGTILNDTWISLGWAPGDFTASHDVYLGDNLNDVNEATRDSDVYRGNQSGLFYVAGFPGYAYEDGLVPGTTYYWRIDEVNEAEPNSPWKGNIWSFSVPPKTAYGPIPADGAESVLTDTRLTWTAGFGSKLHYIFFGDDYDEVSNAAVGVPYGTTNYNPGPLELAKTYYWRVDEFEGPSTHKGEVWSFTTLGAASGPNPANGAVDVKPSVILNWDAGSVAASHEVYFGTDADAVANATTTSPESKGAKGLGEESYDPGKLMFNSDYFWRIDEVNGINPDSPWIGKVWSFTTGDFFVIDDFEDYDTGENQIWFAWHDGLGAGAPGTPGYIPGNGTGSAVGDETSPSYTEETIVHDGSKSMPISYDNNKQGYAYYSEVEHTLTDQRDWTEEGVNELSLWFRGSSSNAAEPLYVAVSNSTGTPAVVVHDDPAAATIDTWTEWVIPLQTFADRGINLTNVDRIAIGLGTPGNMTVPGGSGKMYIDDIRLNQTSDAP